MIKKIISNEKLFRLIQWTWGFPQTFCGAALYMHYRKAPHTDYHGAAVTIWPYESSVSLGMFIFLSDTISGKRKRKNAEDPYAQRLLMHEYGHSIQSLMSGPLYLAIIGLPSFLWNRLPAFENQRNRKNVSYYSVYPEKQANQLGEHYLCKRSV